MYGRSDMQSHAQDEERRTLEQEMHALRAANTKLQRKLDTLKSKVTNSIEQSKTLFFQVQRCGDDAYHTTPQLLAALHARLEALVAEQEATVSKLEQCNLCFF